MRAGGGGGSQPQDGVSIGWEEARRRRGREAAVRAGGGGGSQSQDGVSMVGRRREGGGGREGCYQEGRKESKVRFVQRMWT